MRNGLYLIAVLLVLLVVVWWTAPKPAGLFASDSTAEMSPTSTSKKATSSSTAAYSSGSWKNYSNSQFGYGFSYPSANIFFTDTGGISDLPLAYPPRQLVNLYIKEPPAQEEPVIVNVGVYDKPSTTPLREWILKGYERASSTPMQRFEGSSTPAIDAALAKARGGAQGILTFTETSVGDLSAYEVGAVQRPGALSYARYLTSDKLNYVYVVELRLPFGYVDTKAYLPMYEQILSSFTVLDRPS